VALTLYADTSLLVPLFIRDAFNEAAGRLLSTHRPALLVSDFACAELASAVAMKVRTRQLSLAEAREALATFDGWLASRPPRVETSTADILLAEAHLRRLDLPLRTPDALHIAIAQRREAALATFDVQMAGAARALGVEVIAA
jgi:predicted nucleic acid-binding protein